MSEHPTKWQDPAKLLLFPRIYGSFQYFRGKIPLETLQGPSLFEKWFPVIHFF